MVNRISGNAARNRRELLKQQQGNACYFCGVQMTPVKVKCDGHPRHTSITIEHLKPLCAGGTNAIKNTVAACERCNLENNRRFHLGLPRLEPHPTFRKIRIGFPEGTDERRRFRKQLEWKLGIMQLELAPEYEGPIVPNLVDRELCPFRHEILDRQADSSFTR